MDIYQKIPKMDGRFMLKRMSSGEECLNTEDKCCLESDTVSNEFMTSPCHGAP